jgi:hypothetical protein
MIRVIISKIFKWAGYVAFMGEDISALILENLTESTTA